MDGEVEECVRSGFGHADGAAIARGVDARDANDVARADARAARAIVRERASPGAARSVHRHPTRPAPGHSRRIPSPLARRPRSRSRASRRARTRSGRACARADRRAAPRTRPRRARRRRRATARRAASATSPPAPKPTSSANRTRGERRDDDPSRALLAGVMRVMRVCGVRGAVPRVRRVRDRCERDRRGRVSAVRTMAGVGAPWPAVSDVPKLGEPSHRHRGEPGAAESEAEAIEIHIPNTTCSRAGW